MNWLFFVFCFLPKQSEILRSRQVIIIAYEWVVSFVCVELVHLPITRPDQSLVSAVQLSHWLAGVCGTEHQPIMRQATAPSQFPWLVTLTDGGYSTNCKNISWRGAFVIITCECLLGSLWENMLIVIITSAQPPLSCYSSTSVECGELNWCFQPAAREFSGIPGDKIGKMKKIRVLLFHLNDYEIK